MPQPNRRCQKPRACFSFCDRFVIKRCTTVTNEEADKKELKHKHAELQTSSRRSSAQSVGNTFVWKLEFCDKSPKIHDEVRRTVNVHNRN